MFKNIYLILMLILISITTCHSVSVGENLPNVILDNKNGGTSNKKPWKSKSLKGKVHTVIYMDPDKRNDSKYLTDALKNLRWDSREYSTVAIVNLAATWMPNAVLESKLKSKQKELNSTIYVFDKNRYLVRKWKMKDDASNILVLDSGGKIIYKKSGRISKNDAREILNIIENAIDNIRQ